MVEQGQQNRVCVGVDWNNTISVLNIYICHQSAFPDFYN